MKRKDISIDELIPPSYDVRTQIVLDELEELAVSIRTVGVLVPLRVFKNGSKYEIEDGHRRYLAAQRIGLEVLPCIVIQSEAGVREVKKLHANLFGKDLSPIELSRTLAHLKNEFGYTEWELAHMLGRSQGRVSQLIALQDFKPDLVEAMEDRKIAEHIGRALNKINDDEKRGYYLRYAIDGGATIQTVKKWVARHQAEEAVRAPSMGKAGLTEGHSAGPAILGRCSCCRKDDVLDHLLMMKFCGECYTDLKNIMPSLYEAMKTEREDKHPPPKEEPYP